MCTTYKGLWKQTKSVLILNVQKSSPLLEERNVVMSNPPSAQPHPSQRACCCLNQMCYAIRLAALFFLSSHFRCNFSGLELNGGSHQHHPFGNLLPALWQGLFLEDKPDSPGPRKAMGALNWGAEQGWWFELRVPQGDTVSDDVWSAERR